MLSIRFFGTLSLLLLLYPNQIFASFFPCDTAVSNGGPDLELVLLTTQSGLVKREPTKPENQQEKIEILYTVTNCGPGDTSFDLEVIIYSEANSVVKSNTISGIQILDGRTQSGELTFSTSDIPEGTYEVTGILRNHGIVESDEIDPNASNNVRDTFVIVTFEAVQPPEGGDATRQSASKPFLTILSQTEILVSWDLLNSPIFEECVSFPPALDSQGRPVIETEDCVRLIVEEYNLRWRAIGEEWDSIREIKVKGANYTISNLKQNTDYLFSIQPLYVPQNKNCTTHTTYAGDSKNQFTSCINGGWYGSAFVPARWSEVSSARTFPDYNFSAPVVSWLIPIIHLLLN